MSCRRFGLDPIYQAQIFQRLQLKCLLQDWPSLKSVHLLYLIVSLNCYYDMREKVLTKLELLVYRSFFGTGF